MQTLPNFLLAATLMLTASAADFHLSPTGSDSGDGSAGKPFATISHARDVARKAGGKNSLLLAPGNYFNAASIQLDDRDSNLNIKGAKPGAVAKVYGGMPVTGWVKWKGDIWRAPVPKGVRFFNLIVGDEPGTMAQTPNKGSGYGGGVGKLGNTSLVVPVAWRGYDYSDAQVFSFIGSDWFSEMRKVNSAKPNAVGVLSIDGGSGQFRGMNNRFFIRGVLEFLDEPGEWCLKHQEGFVYYWPKSGTPNDTVIVRPTSERLLDITGRKPETPVSGVKIENLSLIGSDFCERWYLFGPRKDGTTPGPLQQGMVFAENVKSLTVSGCKLLAAGHSAVWLNHAAEGCVVENNLIQYAGFAGIYMNGWDLGEGPFKSVKESYVNKNHRIESNFLYDCGQYVGAGCGIQFYQSGDNLITRNEIGQMPRYGISYKGNRWGQFPRTQYGEKLTFETHFDSLHTRRNKLIGNDIYSVCRNSVDFGGIESWSSGRDNLWDNNAIHDIDLALMWDGWAHILFADDASHYLTTSNNILYHCHGGALTGAFMMKGIGETIENNLLADSLIGRTITMAPYIEPGWNFTVRKNVFDSNGVYKRYDANEKTYNGHGGTYGPMPKDAKGIIEVDRNTINPTNKELPNSAEYVKHGIDKNSHFGDTKLKRAKPAWDIQYADYSLAPDSPAFKLGYKKISTDNIGLKTDYPFDTKAATRRLATDKIQAEGYQRMHKMRTLATHGGIGYLVDGAWSKYSNIDFGKGETNKITFQLTAPASGPAVAEFVRKYGEEVVTAIPFTGNKTVETITKWEISKVYKKEGKTGNQLFDEKFAPESDINAGEWKLWAGPTPSRAGVTSTEGVVDVDVTTGEGNENSCAYLRTSIFAPIGRTNATMTASCGSGVKVWLNGNLVIAENKPGVFSETSKGIIRAGWNTILIKVNQDNAKWVAKTKGDGNFWVKFGTVASGCGRIVYLPGLPTKETAIPENANTLLSIHLDAPNGPVIGSLEKGKTSCAIKKVTGIHNVYLVFTKAPVQWVDWFRFEN